MKVTLGKYKKNGSKRTTKVQIDPWDTWSLDSNLALIIHPALVEFKRELESHPAQFESIEEWKAVLDKMIFSFDSASRDDSEDEFYSGDFTEPFFGPESTIKIDFDGLEAHYKKVQEGFELFGKHFQSLWN